MKFASSFPIIGAHYGYEAQLLIAGKKPIGMFVDVTVPNVSAQDMPRHIQQSRSDIQQLSGLCAEGKLSSTKFDITDENGAVQNWHFFCQLGKEGEMQELADGTLFAINNPEERCPFPDSKDQGAYLGYRDIDIELFSCGGFRSLNYLTSQVLSWTNDRRRRAYASLLLEGHLER